MTEQQRQAIEAVTAMAQARHALNAATCGTVQVRTLDGRGWETMTRAPAEHFRAQIARHAANVARLDAEAAQARGPAKRPILRRAEDERRSLALAERNLAIATARGAA